MSIFGSPPSQPETTQILANGKRELGAAHVSAGAGVDLDRLAFFDEKRNVNRFAGLEFCRLGYVAGSVAPNSCGRLDDFQADRRRHFELDRLAIGVEDLNAEVFDEIIFRVADQIFMAR